MTRQYKIGRSLVSRKLAGAIFAVFALFVQPLVALDVPSAFAAGTSGSVVINEFSANNGTDWVELYNTSGAAIDLTDWSLKDSDSEMKSLSGSVVAGGFATFDVGTRLNQNDDEMYLLDNEDVQIDHLAYPANVTVPTAGKYAARTTDGASAWELRVAHSKNASNNLAGATLSSTLGSVAATNVPVEFESTITKAVGSGDANIRVETEVAPSQAANMLFEFKQGSTYHDMPYVGGKFIFGQGAPFSLQTATSEFRITFSAPGTYTSVARIINAADNSVIGAPLTRVVTVEDPSGTRYVDATGSDTANFCTDESLPCKTIQRAINQATTGEVIEVAAGEYVGPVNVNKSVTLKGSQAGADARPSADSARSADNADESIVTVLKNQRAFNITADDVVIDGFVVVQTGGSGSSDAIKADSSLSGITIKNNLVKDATDEAIQLEAGNDYVIERNYVLNSLGDGITLSTYAPFKGNNLKIVDNEIVGSRSAYGSIYLYGAQNVIVSGNTIATDGTGVAAGSGDQPVQNISIENNHITTELQAVVAVQAGVVVEGNSANVNIQKNTITQPATATVSPHESTSPASFSLIRIGVATTANPSNVAVKYNNLSRITPVNYIYVNPGVTTDIVATQNWWNSNVNPSSKINDASRVDYQPWLCEAYTGQPDPKESINGVCDATAPEVTITSMTAPVSNTSAFTITGTVKDEETAVTDLTVTINGASYAPLMSGSDWSVTIPANTLTDGTYAIKATAKNQAELEQVAEGFVTIDSTPPVFYGFGAARNADGSYTLSATSISPDIDMNTVQLLLNGNPISFTMTDNLDGTFTWSGVTSVLVEGLTYSFMVKAADMIGNETLASVYPFVPTVTLMPIESDFSNENGSISSLSRVAPARTLAQSAVDNSDDGGDAKAEVLGTSIEDDTDPRADEVAAIAPSEEGWKLWGIAWYWYLLALGALGVGGWYGLKLYRNREADF